MMRNILRRKSIWKNSHLWYISGITVICTLFYYLPSIAGLMGWASARENLEFLHNLFGIDFLGFAFFIPVVYAAYKLGIVPAVMTAL